MEELVLDQLLPSPDEAPLTNCPHCGEEFNTSETDPSDYYEVVVEETPETCGIYRHKSCGKLCRFVPTGADSKI